MNFVFVQFGNRRKKRENKVGKAKGRKRLRHSIKALEWQTYLSLPQSVSAVPQEVVCHHRLLVKEHRSIGIAKCNLLNSLCLISATRIFVKMLFWNFPRFIHLRLFSYRFMLYIGSLGHDFINFNSWLLWSFVKLRVLNACHLRESWIVIRLTENWDGKWCCWLSDLPIRCFLRTVGEKRDLIPYTYYNLNIWCYLIWDRSVSLWRSFNLGQKKKEQSQCQILWMMYS